MRTFKLVLLAVMAAGLSLAAPWDGTKGNLTLFTTSYNTGMPGLILMPNPATFTMLWITTTDPNTTSFRVTVKYKNDQGDPATVVAFCDRPTGGIAAAAAVQLDPAVITSIAIEELRASAPVEFSGQN